MDTLPIFEDSPSSSLYSMNYFEGIFCKKKKKQNKTKKTHQEGKEKGITKEQEESLGVAVEIQRYTLPYVKQIASGDLLYDSGNSNWGCVTI